MCNNRQDRMTIDSGHLFRGVIGRVCMRHDWRSNS